MPKTDTAELPPADLSDRSGTPTTPCVEWSGYCNPDGYGYQWDPVAKKVRRAHRIAYEQHVGPIPPGLYVLHRCDNPPCVNADHLYAGTQKDNVKDRDVRQRRRPPKGRLNGRAKLTFADVVEIRQRTANGETSASLAVAFGVARSQVGRIVRGEQWAS